MIADDGRKRVILWQIVAEDRRIDIAAAQLVDKTLAGVLVDHECRIAILLDMRGIVSDPLKILDVEAMILAQGGADPHACGLGIGTHPDPLPDKIAWIARALAAQRNQAATLH